MKRTKANTNARKSKAKNVSLKKSLSTIVEVVKDVFGHHKQKTNDSTPASRSLAVQPSKKDVVMPEPKSDAIDNDDDIFSDLGDEKEHPNSCAQATVEHPETNFFYTNDKFLNSFEDAEMIQYIQASFPNFKSIDANDMIVRKTIIDMLNDSKFMNKFLKYYNIDIFEFFKFLYRVEPSVFKGLFLKRVQKAVKYKKYAAVAKRSTRKVRIAKRSRKRSKK